MPAKLPDGAGKRHGLSLRTTLETQTRLKEAAARSGRSIAQEVEWRLEKSFEEEDKKKEDEKNNLVALALQGDEKTAEWLRNQAAAMGAAMAYAEGHWENNIYAKICVKAACEAVMERTLARTKTGTKREDLDISRVEMMMKAGVLYGRVLVKMDSDDDFAEALRASINRIPLDQQAVLETLVAIADDH